MMHRLLNPSRTFGIARGPEVAAGLVASQQSAHPQGRGVRVAEISAAEQVQGSIHCEELGQDFLLVYRQDDVEEASRELSHYIQRPEPPALLPVAELSLEGTLAPSEDLVGPVTSLSDGGKFMVLDSPRNSIHPLMRVAGTLLKNPVVQCGALQALLEDQEALEILEEWSPDLVGYLREQGISAMGLLPNSVGFPEIERLSLEGQGRLQAEGTAHEELGPMQKLVVKVAAGVDRAGESLAGLAQWLRDRITPGRVPSASGGPEKPKAPAAMKMLMVMASAIMAYLIVRKTPMVVRRVKRREQAYGVQES